MANPRSELSILAEIDVSQGLRKASADINNWSRSLAPIKVKFDSAPLGVITGQSSEFQKSLAASQARVLAFGATAGQIYLVSRAFTSLIKSTIQVEKSLKDVNVILGLSTKQLTSFGNDLFKVANQTGQSFQVAADAAVELSRQGLSAVETLKRVKDALTLTRLSGLDVVSSVTAITTAINGFNDSALDSTAIINKLANVDAQFAVSSKDLADSLSRVGSTANDVGVSFDQLIGLVTAAKQITGREGSVIGNSLKTIFQRIERPEVLENLREIGVLTQDLSGKSLGATEVLTNLARAYKTLSSAQQNQVIQLSAGVFQANQFRAILSDLAQQNSITSRATEASANSSDQAARRQAELNKTLSANINETINNLTNLAAKAGQITFEPVIKRAGTLVSVFTEALTANDGEGRAETIGGTIGTGLLRGIGNYLSGPGLAAAGALLIKFFGSFASFTTKSLSQIIESSSKRYALEQATEGLLNRQPQLLSQIVKLGGDQIKIRQLINQELTRELALLNQIGAAKQLVTSDVSRTYALGTIRTNKPFLPSDVTGLARNPRYKAAVGLIPKIQETVGAIQGGYQPGEVKQLNVPHLGQVYYNTAEKVKYFPGLSQPAIIPPQNSKAGINYAQNFQKSHGFDPYAANGYVPKSKWYDKLNDKRKEALKKYLKSNEDYVSNTFPEINSVLDEIIKDIPKKGGRFDGLIPNYNLTQKPGSMGEYYEGKYGDFLLKGFRDNLNPEKFLINSLKKEGVGKDTFEKYIPEAINSLKSLGMNRISYTPSLADGKGAARVKLFDRLIKKYNIQGGIFDSHGLIPNYANSPFSVPSVGLGPVLGTGGAKTVFGVKSLLGSNLDISKIVASTARRNSKVKDEEVLSHVFGDFQDLGALNKRGIPFFPKFHGLANIQGTIPYGGINKTAGLIEKNNIIGTQGFDEILNNAGIDLPTDELYHAEQEILAQSIGRQIGKYGLGAYPRKLVNGRVITGDLKPANLGYRNSNALEAISRGLFQNKLTGSSSILDAQIARVLESGDLTIVDPGGINLNATKRIQVSAGGMIPSNRYTKNLLQGKRGLLSYTTDNVEKQAIINNIRSSLGVEQGGVGKELYPKLFETLKSQGINQVVGSLVNQGRTPKSGDAVDKLKALFPQLTRGRYASKNELNFSDSDYRIPLEGGDKFDGDLKKKAALILKKAAISSSFGYRSYLNKGLVPNYAYVPGISQMVGKLVTNITHSGAGFSWRALKPAAEKVKEIGIRQSIKQILKDKPLYSEDDFFGARHGDGDLGFSDMAFREMFGLKPRIQPNVPFTRDGKTVTIGKQGNEIVANAISYTSQLKRNSSGAINGVSNNSDFGNFGVSLDPKTKNINYRDTWDFALHKGSPLPKFGEVLQEIKDRSGFTNLSDRFKGAITQDTLKDKIRALKTNVFNKEVISTAIKEGINSNLSFKADNSGDMTNYGDSPLTRLMRHAVGYVTSPLTFKGSISPKSQEYSTAIRPFEEFQRRDIRSARKNIPGTLEFKRDFEYKSALYRDKLFYGKKPFDRAGDKNPFIEGYTPKSGPPEGWGLIHNGLVPNFSNLGLRAAAIKYGGKIYKGELHYEAFEKVMAEHPEVRKSYLERRDSSKKYLNQDEAIYGGLPLGYLTRDGEFISKEKAKANFGIDFSSQIDFANKGLVPNFNALTSAIQREIKAGIPTSQIRVGASSRIAGASNPLGLGVYNTKDEPLGLNQGINRVAAMGLDPKKAGIPNYAKGDEFFGGIIGVGENVRNRLDLSTLNEEIKKYQQQIRFGQRNQTELNRVVRDLTKEFKLSDDAASRIEKSFNALYQPVLRTQKNIESGRKLLSNRDPGELPFSTNPPDIFGYSSGNQLPLSAGKLNPQLSPELRKQALAAALAKNRARLGGDTNVQSVGERPAFNDPRAIENYRKEYTESLSKTQSEISRVQNEAERQVAADAEREILQQESLIKKSRQIERNTSRFDKLFGNTGLLEINKYRKALKFADENGLDASKRQLKERLSQRALTSSFVIPALGGIAEQGVTSLFGDDSRAARGASRATGGLANVASFAATGFGISGGNPIGAVAGAGVGLLTELPSVIKSFTDTLPDLVKNLEKLRTESNKTNNAFNTFLSSTQKLISIDSGESRATVGQRRTIERERTLSLASIPSAARSQIKEAAEKGDIAKVADISSRYARLSEQKSIFSQDIIALSQAENKNKFGFRDRFNTAYSSVGGGKESGLLFNALAANSAFFTSGASYLGTPRKEGSGRAVGEAIESSKRLRDFENTQELDNLVKPVIQSTLQFANKSGKTFSESLTDQDIADLNGSRGRGIDAFINAFAGKLRSKGIDSKDFEKDIRNAPAEVQESFARGSGKLITRKSIDDTARESEVIRKATAEFSFSLASLSESILNSSIKAKEAATAFEIDVSRKFAKAATGIEIGRIRRDASSETSLIGLGNNEFLKASLDGSNDLADAKSNFNLSSRRIEGQKLVQTRNFLTTQKDDFQESVRSAVSSDPTIAKNPDDYNKAVGRNINFLDEVFNANNPQSAIAKAREKLRELEVNSKSENVTANLIQRLKDSGANNLNELKASGKLNLSDDKDSNLLNGIRKLPEDTQIKLYSGTIGQLESQYRSKDQIELLRKRTQEVINSLSGVINQADQSLAEAQDVLDNAAATIPEKTKALKTILSGKARRSRELLGINSDFNVAEIDNSSRSRVNLQRSLFSNELLKGKSGTLEGVEIDRNSRSLEITNATQDRNRKIQRDFSEGLISGNVVGNIAKGNVLGGVTELARLSTELNAKKKESLAIDKAQKAELEEITAQERKRVELSEKFLENRLSSIRGRNQGIAADGGSLSKEQLRESFFAPLVQTSEERNNEASKIVETFFVDVKDSFKSGFRDILSGTKTFKEGLSAIGLEIASRVSGKTTDLAIDTLLGAGSSFLGLGKKANGGYINKYSSGGFVNKGSGVRDDVPALLTGGEFVLNKKAVNKIGKNNLDNLNFGSLKGYAGGGSASINLLNEYDTDNRLFNVSPLLSAQGQTDENNPQNALKFQREAYGFEYNRYLKERGKFLKDFEKKKMQALYVAFGSAAINAGAGAYSQYSAPKFDNNISSDFSGFGVSRANGGIIPSIGSIKRYANGGYVGGDKPSDRLGAMVMGGEYIMSPKTVSKYGVGLFNNLNKSYAGGGIVGDSSSVSDNMSEMLAKLSEINESIMGKASDGKTGQDTRQSAAAPTYNITVNTTVNSTGGTTSTTTSSGGDSKETSKQDRENANKMNEVIKNKVLEGITEQSRPGGILYERFAPNQ